MKGIALIIEIIALLILVTVIAIITTQYISDDAVKEYKVRYSNGNCTG